MPAKRRKPNITRVVYERYKSCSLLVLFRLLQDKTVPPGGVLMIIGERAKNRTADAWARYCAAEFRRLLSPQLVSSGKLSEEERAQYRVGSVPAVNYRSPVWEQASRFLEIEASHPFFTPALRVNRPQITSGLSTIIANRVVDELDLYKEHNTWFQMVRTAHHNAYHAVRGRARS